MSAFGSPRHTLNVTFIYIAILFYRMLAPIKEASFWVAMGSNVNKCVTEFKNFYSLLLALLVFHILTLINPVIDFICCVKSPIIRFIISLAHIVSIFLISVAIAAFVPLIVSILDPDVSATLLHLVPVTEFYSIAVILNIKLLMLYFSQCATELFKIVYLLLWGRKAYSHLALLKTSHVKTSHADNKHSFLVDSGASEHIQCITENFVDNHSCHKEFAGVGSRLTAKSSGTARYNMSDVSKLLLKNVYHLPQGDSNLWSVARLHDSGHRVDFWKQKIMFLIFFGRRGNSVARIWKVKEYETPVKKQAGY